MTKNLSFLVFFGLLLIISGCSGSGSVSDERPLVVATTMMLEDALIQIGGDLIRVQGLMGPGVDPHLYRPTPSNFRSMERADLIVYNGLHLEARLSEILGKMQEKAWPAAEVIPENSLIRAYEYGGTFDPHVWFDATLWIMVVEGLGTRLEKLIPDESETIRSNTSAYLNILSELHYWTMAEIASIPAPQRVLITAHDAFGYFGRVYNIEVNGLQGLSTQSDYGLQDVSSMVHFIIDREIPAVFIETSISPRSIQAIRNGVSERGGNVTLGGELYSDAMGARGTPEGTYIGMVQHNVNTITSALKK